MVQRMPIAREAKRCFRRSIIAGSVGLVLAALTGCDSRSAGPGGREPRQVSVTGSGQVQGVPDTLTADVGIEFVESDVSDAMNRTSQRQQAVTTALVDAGVDRSDISTTQVSLQPEYGGSVAFEGGTITGYRADNSIRVKIHPAKAASHVLAVIVDTGGDATRIDSVSYSIEDDSALVKDARVRAFQDAKDRAGQYARLSGLTLGSVISISEGNATPPTSAPQSMAPDVPLEPGQQPVDISLTAVWELR